MLTTRDDVQAVTDRALSFATADETEIDIAGAVTSNLRLARSTSTTSGTTEVTTLSVTSAFGKQTGVSQTTDLSDDGLRAVVARAEEIARLSPESPEYMPRLGPQNYAAVAAWDDATAAMSPAARAEIARQAIDAARAAGVTVAGYLRLKFGFQSIANNRGQLGYFASTGADFKLTARSDGGSGWAADSSFRVADIDGAAVTNTAIAKALQSQRPVEIPPGPYTVVLEPSTAADIAALYLWHADRREADEGRSYFATVPLGSKHLSEQVSIYSDPAHPALPVKPWGVDGQPLRRTNWVNRGVVENLCVSRYWAAEKGIEPVPFPSNLIMDGGDISLDDLVASTERGLLVTSFWYIRRLDPKPMLVTGLTRDGLFLIEDGKVTKPVVNFRWNESPAAVLQSVEALSRPQRAVGRQSGIAYVPAIKASGFRFTSVSPSS